MSPPTRRLALAGAALSCVSFVGFDRAQAADLLGVDFAKLVSRADLTYSEPATRSEEGMPVGNGRMGSLVWTTPSALKLQVNRADVFGADSTTTSFPQADSDYASGCAYVDVNLVDYGDDVFDGPGFRQHLSLYDGAMTVEGRGVVARVVAWPQRDVMAIEVEDRRERPGVVSVDLRMLRYQAQYVPKRTQELADQHAVVVRRAEHTATSRPEIREGRTVLVQRFQERAFYSSSAVAVEVVGRPARARFRSESTVQLSAAPGPGRFTILVSSAASFDPSADVAAMALGELDAARGKAFEGLRAETAEWWHDFWSKGFVYLHSASGQADFVEQNYTYFLYLMGASSRGRYPPRFGGMLWYTNGDMRRWGSQYWWANTNAYYSNLMPANRLDLMDPMFAMYSGMYDACATAARQQWGSEGIWIPETTFFNGPETLPDDVAAELRDLYLARKPWDQRSAAFQRFAETKPRHTSRWNFQADGRWDHGHWVVPDKGKGIFGHTTHILGAGARIAALYWQRYLFTLDEEWLRERAYPMIKGAAEFYRHFPNLRKGEDGRYHVHHLNDGESAWDTSDTPYELSSMHTIFPLAIRASEVLGVDTELRPLWREIEDHLVPAPPPRPRGPFGAFVYAGEGAIEPVGPEPDQKRRFLGFTRLGSFIDPEGIGGARIFRNRMRLREGPGAIDAEHIGGLAAGIHSTLLASAAGTPDGEPVLRLFDAWPKDWDAAFALRAHGGFVVRSVQLEGRIRLVEIRSEAGRRCRFANPWAAGDVSVYRDGKVAEALSGETLTIATRKGETIVVVPAGSMPAPTTLP